MVQQQLSYYNSTASSSIHQNASSFNCRSSPALLLSHFVKMPGETIFIPSRLYHTNEIKLHIVHTYFALLNIEILRGIGGKPFCYIDSNELDRHLGSDNAKRNRRAVLELKALGLWCQDDGGRWYPADRVEQLHLTFKQRRGLGDWLASLNRKEICVPRVLLELFPRLNPGPLALCLELLARCKDWTGNKDKTTGTVDLNLSHSAERWGVCDRTLRNALSEGLGRNVRLELQEGGPRYCRHFRVVIGPGVGDPTPDTHDPAPMSSSQASPTPVSTTAGEQRADSTAVESEHDFSGLRAENEHDFSGLPDLKNLNPLLQRDIKPSNPPDAAQDPGACQPGEGNSQDEDATQGKTTDTSLANTANLLPADSDPEDPDVTAPDLDALPTTTAAPLPTDWAPELEAETLTPGDDLDTLSADTTDLRPLDPEPEPTLETPAAADPPLPPSDWLNIIPADLTDRQWQDALYDQITARRILPRGEASRLMVYTAARHALKTDGILNRPALFRQIIQSRDRRVLDDGRVVSYLTDEDEQAALAWIKAQQPAPVDRELRLVRQPDAPPVLSEDAKIVAHFLVDLLDGEGYRGDLFHRFKQTDEGAGWTRQRWDATLAELETPTAPTDPSPAVTAPDLPICRSEFAQMNPPIVAMGSPSPAAETSPQKQTEAHTLADIPEQVQAATERKNTGMVPSTPHKADVPTFLASHIASDASSASPPDPDVADVAGSGPWQEGPEAMFWGQTWLKLDRIKTPLHGIPISRLRYASEGDLRDDGFLVGLYEEALSMGHMQENEGGPLVFFAAAEHALYAGGIANRPWLFRTIVVRGKWSLVTYEAEHRGRQRLDAMDSSRQSP